jgi:hypothetical protein
MALHIFWDNSNVWGCAQNVREIEEPLVPWFTFRIHFRNLYKLIVKERDVATKVMAGSVPPECESLWEYARELGFNTDLLYRIESTEGKKQEQAVDEILHLKMSNAVLDFSPPQTMVLLSGDGKVSEFGTSFPNQIERALKQGWNAEIYSWRNCYNQKMYTPICERYESKIQVIFLDQYYKQLTFVKGQDGCYRMNESSDKIYFDVKPRNVEPMRL